LTTNRNHRVFLDARSDLNGSRFASAAPANVEMTSMVTVAIVRFVLSRKWETDRQPVTPNTNRNQSRPDQSRDFTPFTR
jgi:hypothetical protein